MQKFEFFPGNPLDLKKVEDIDSKYVVVRWCDIVKAVEDHYAAGSCDKSAQDILLRSLLEKALETESLG